MVKADVATTVAAPEESVVVVKYSDPTTELAPIPADAATVAAVTWDAADAEAAPDVDTTVATMEVVVAATAHEPVADAAPLAISQTTEVAVLLPVDAPMQSNTEAGRPVAAPVPEAVVT